VGTELMDSKNKRTAVTIAKVAGVGVVGFIVAPMVFVAIQGVVGMLVVGAILLVSFMWIPVAVDWAANMKLQGIKFVAGRNPVETLQNDYQKKQEALQTFRQKIVDFDSAISIYRDKVEEFKTRWPADAPKYAAQLKTMCDLLSLRQKKYKEAVKTLDNYQAEIEKASDMWDMSVAAAKMNKASGMNSDDFMTKIRVDTSYDAIQKNMASAFAELDTSLMESEDEKNMGKVIDVDAVKVRSDN